MGSHGQRRLAASSSIFARHRRFLPSPYFAVLVYGCAEGVHAIAGASIGRERMMLQPAMGTSVRLGPAAAAIRRHGKHFACSLPFLIISAFVGEAGIVRFRLSYMPLHAAAQR